jgi:regulatory protein YycI of two-component signal transduction system YycFG
MTESDKTKLKGLLLDAIDAHKKLQDAKQNMEQARARFGYAKLYDDEARFINVDGEIWSVTVPFPYSDHGDELGRITVELLGDCL